jgi:tetratricopeptide (TPR) repeat protein
MSGPRPTPPPPSEGTGPARGADWRAVAGVAAIAGAVVAAYGRTFSGPFVFDDVFTIANNPTLGTWRGAFFPPLNTTASGRPVLNLSLALNHAISGTDVWSYHAVNLAIHVLAALVLFGILRRTPIPLAGPAAASIAFLSALLWSLHPLQTESVTYIVQRAESLMGLFYLATLYGFIRGAAADGRARLRWFALSFAACLLGMATKEVMVSAPVMALLYDRTFLAGSFREAWIRRRRVYAALGATWLVLPFLVASTHGRAGTSGFGSGVGFWSYALTQFPAIVRYLRLSAWPHPLVFDYGTQWVSGLSEVWPSALAILALLAGTAWALCRSGPAGRALGFAGAWFFAILAPTSLVPGNRQTAAEHRMYLALIPVVVLFVVFVHRRLGRFALPVCLVLAAALGGATWMRNRDYRSALAIWSDTVARCPENAFAHDNLGTALVKIPGRLPEAIAQYEWSLRLRPNDPQTHNNLGYALEQTPGRLPEAIEQYREAIRLNPADPVAHYNLGNALKSQGAIPGAIAEYEETLRLFPDYAGAHINLGNALLAEGRTDEALAQYRRAIALAPRQAGGYDDLGNALARIPGRLPEAVAQFETAVRLDPRLAEARNSLGNALYGLGRLPEAAAQFDEALRLDPGYAEAHNDLGNVLSSEGRIPEAIAQFRESIRLKPDYAQAHYNLGNVFDAAGRNAEALSEFEEAVRLDPGYADAHNNLGNVLARIPGRLPDAIAQYEAALRLEPDEAGIHMNLAFALLRTPGRTDEAAAELEAALRIQPGNAAAQKILAEIRAAQGNR